MDIVRTRWRLDLHRRIRLTKLITFSCFNCGKSDTIMLSTKIKLRNGNEVRSCRNQKCIRQIKLADRNRMDGK